MRRHKARRNTVGEVYEIIRWCWVALALTSLILQAMRGVDISPMHAQILNVGELVITIAFNIKIIVRFIAHLPDWRGFFVHGNNYLDLVLAILSCHFGDTTYEAAVAFRVRTVVCAVMIHKLRAVTSNL